MKKGFYLLSVILLISTYSLAQDANEAKNKLQQLDPLTGSWTVTVEARLSAQGPWDTSTGKSVIIKTLGTSILEENFTGTRQGKPFLAKTLFAVNNLTQKYQRIFADSEHGLFVDFDGEQQGNTFIFDRLWVYPNKSTVKLRVVYTVISKDEFMIESMRMPQSESSWDVTGRMKYIRTR